MGFADDKEWDKYRNERHRPGQMSRERKIKVYGGFGILIMAMVLAIAYFSP